MSVTAEMVKSLRKITSAGMMECKRALVDSNGDIEKATELLRKKGAASAEKKAGRIATEGKIVQKISPDTRHGVLLEVNCETDFVARTDDFKELCHNLAMQIAAMSPIYINADEIPDDEKRSPEELALTSQAYIRDPAVSVSDLILEAAGKLGENVKIKRFSRFALGE